MGFKGFKFFETIEKKPLEKPQKTSEQYKDKVKIFLDSIDVRYQNVSRRTFFMLYNLDNFELPKPDEQLRIRTQTQLNLIFVILKIIEIHGKIDELTIASYTLNRESFTVLKDLILGNRVGKVNFLIASSYSYRDEKYFQYLQDECRILHKFNNDIHLVFAWSHFKITLARCGQSYYQFEGSMNYSTNNMAEQLLLENCKQSYDYDYNFITNVMQNQSNSALQIVC